MNTVLEITQQKTELVIVAGNHETVLEINQPRVELLTVGIQGASGASAYQIAVAGGFSGSEEQWLESLRGSSGRTPTNTELLALIAPLIPQSQGADANFVFVQMSASAIWAVNHNLNKYPSVIVVDSSETVVIGNIQYLDANNLIISFSAPFGGKAILN